MMIVKVRFQFRLALANRNKLFSQNENKEKLTEKAVGVKNKEP